MPRQHGTTPSVELPLRFELVLEADPGNFRLPADRAHHLLPGLFGSVEAIGAHLERAVRATRASYGGSIMVKIVTAVMPGIDIDALPGRSDDRFMNAVRDLSSETSGQVDLNKLAAKISACRRLHPPELAMCRYIREICAPVW